MPWLIIPLPPDSLRTNRRRGQHWAVTRKAAADYRAAVATEALLGRAHWQGIPVMWPAPLRIYLYLGKGQRADNTDVGGWLKEALDELTEAGCWPDDNSSRLDPVTTTVRRDWADPRVCLIWGDDPEAKAVEGMQGWPVRVSPVRRTSYRQREG